MVAGACGVGGGQEGIVREFGMDMHTLPYFKWITNKDLLSSTRNNTQCYVAVWMACMAVQGRMDTCVCMAESLPCSPETFTVLFVTGLVYPNTK